MYFFVFNIESFHLSISLDLYEKALNFAKQITRNADSDLRIIKHSRKSLLFHGSEPFIKRVGKENFDVPMGLQRDSKIPTVHQILRNKFQNPSAKEFANCHQRKKSLTTT